MANSTFRKFLAISQFALATAPASGMAQSSKGYEPTLPAKDEVKIELEADTPPERMVQELSNATGLNVKTAECTTVGGKPAVRFTHEKNGKTVEGEFVFGDAGDSTARYWKNGNISGTKDYQALSESGQEQFNNVRRVTRTMCPK